MSTTDQPTTQKDESINRLWDERALAYSQHAAQNFRQAIKYHLLDRFARIGDACLDIGIADGIFAIPLAAKVREIHGVDISEQMLAECRANLEREGITNVFLHQKSASDLPFAADTFDLVYSFATLALVPEIEQAFSQVQRVLKPHGKALLDITGKNNLSYPHWDRFYKAQGHFGLHAYALEEIAQILPAKGFRVLEVLSAGVLDQWKYIPGMRSLKFLEKVFHATRDTADLDFVVSQWLPAYANHWFFVLEKTA